MSLPCIICLNNGDKSMAAWCSSFIKELSPRLIGLTSCAGLGLSGVLSRRFLTQENPKLQTTIAPIAPLDPKKITPFLTSRHSYAALSFAIHYNPAGLSRPEVLSLAEQLATQDPDINDRSARARLFNDLVSTYPEVLTADTIVQILKDPRSLNFLVHLHQLRNFPDLKLAENLRPLLTLGPR